MWFSISFVTLMFRKWQVQGKTIHRTELELSALKHWSHIGLVVGKEQLSVKGGQSYVKSYMELEEFLISEFVALLVPHVLFP